MIEFESVTFTHPSGVTAIRDVSLQIAPGELVAIVGANGAGKTTLVKHINGLLKPTKGTVRVFELDTRKTSVADLSRHVGIVFQNADHQLFSETVQEEIAFGLRNLGLKAEMLSKRLDWALGFFELEQYRDVAPLILSGGEKKRLCLACVLAWDPEVIILDEPTVGQDYTQKEKLEQMIRMLLTRGRTAIVVSHDIEFVWSLQPRVLVMAGGQILSDGPADQVFTDDNLLENANVRRPQLVEFARLLDAGPEKPFRSVHDARMWIVHQLKR